MEDRTIGLSSRDGMGEEYYENASETDGAERLHCVSGRSEGEGILSPFETGRSCGIRDKQLYRSYLQGESWADGEYACKEAGYYG